MASRLARGFFHRDLSRSDAEKFLRESPDEGAFLVRTSRSHADAYVLSIRLATGEITHSTIRRTNEGFFFDEKRECFSTLYDLIDHYRRYNTELRDKNNEVIELITPILAQMPTLEKYYHGPITHSHVISLLEKCDQVGTFLVRDSETNPGDYVICLKMPDEINNIKIRCTKDYCFLDGNGQRQQIERFKSLDELIHFYMKNNLLIGLNQVALRLVQPYTANWFYARDIHQRCEYLSKSSPTANGPKTGFRLEFELLNQQSESQSSAFHKRNGEKPENRNRNRFRNILPYDETRLVLKNYPPTDYMNANRIRTPFDNVRREYIATQGPLPVTVNDFWHMIQQEMVTCIVMITRETENAKNKCARYWPDLNTKRQYGTVTVETLNESSYEVPQDSGRMSRKRPALASQSQMLSDIDCFYRLRTLRITTEDRRQWNIFHWQYLGWSDHDSPLGTNQRDQQQLNALLDFFRRIAGSTVTGPDQHASPIVIHCSAGIGRSGATIAIDILIHRIDKEGLNTDIDIPSLVKYIRSQRSGLVQTERQYELIYRLIEYYVEQIQQHQPSHSAV